MYMHIMTVTDPRPQDPKVRQDFLDKQPTYWLKRAYQALRRRMDAELRPFGITLSQRDALLALHHGGPQSLTELADSLGLEQSSVSRLALGLRRRRLLDLRADDIDRRTKRVSITPEGTRLLESTPGSSGIAGHILAGALTPAEMSRLISLLRKATAHLEGTAT